MEILQINVGGKVLATRAFLICDFHFHSNGKEHKPHLPKPKPSQRTFFYYKFTWVLSSTDQGNQRKFQVDKGN